MINRYLAFRCVFTFVFVFLLHSAYCQQAESDGFIPNRGQFGKIKEGKGIIGKLDDKFSEVWVIDKGLELSYNIVSLKNMQIKDSTLMYTVKILNSNPISLDKIELFDSSSNTLNYYLPHCKDGILDVRSYRTVLIKSILPNINWEIKYDPSSKINS